MSKRIKNKAELLLSLLFAGEQDSSSGQYSTSIEGITRLEKLLFILKIEEGFLADVPEKDDFNFVPFRLGPWTNEVYDEVDFLESLGLLDKENPDQCSAIDSEHDNELFSAMVLDTYQQNSIPRSEECEVFELTAAGKEKALEIWNRLSDQEKNIIIRVKRKFNKMNLKQLLRYVYKRHSEYTAESEIKDYLGIS